MPRQTPPRFLPWHALALAALLLLAACGAGTLGGTPPAEQSASPAAGEPLRVVATTSIVGDVVRRVGGDRIELVTLMGLGVDPHTYVATPSDTAAVHDAQLLFASGAGLEEGLPELAQGLAAAALEVRLSDGLAEIQAAQGDLAGSAAAPDPHVWLDVRSVMDWVGTVEKALCALDPAGTAQYQANAAEYRLELEELDAWIVEQVAALPPEERTLAANHETLGYLARRYGFTLMGAVYPLSPSSEPSARDLAALEEAIAQHSLRVLFTESTVSQALAEQVAADTGVVLVPLYTESLGPPGSGADTYLSMMRYDVQAIVAALQNPPAGANGP